MNTQNFEKKLIQMTKPEVNQLKHQDLLAKAITNAKDKSVVSWWWLTIPLYITAMFLMKSVYMPHTSLISNIHEFSIAQKISSIIFFLILPIVFIFINFFSIQNVYFLSGSPKTLSFLKTIWLNIIMIFFSILILIIYLL
jgi:hypothetical protein